MSTLPNPRWGLFEQIFGAYSLTAASIMLGNLIAITPFGRNPFAVPLRDDPLMMLLICPAVQCLF
jgi:hypothetical protein